RPPPPRARGLLHRQQRDERSHRSTLAPSLRAQRSNPVKRPAVYIMASKRNGTLYTGVTSSLVHRAWQHREGMTDGFTKRHGCKLFVWFELHATMPDAIARE